MDRKFMLMGLGFALLGLVLGIYMAASHNHGQLVTHAHIMLVGFVVSVVYGVCHRLWIAGAMPGLAKVQYYLHLGGTVVMSLGLFLLYGRFVRVDLLDPLLAISSVAILAAMGIMKYLFIRFGKASC